MNKEKLYIEDFFEKETNKYIISAICIENKDHINILKKHMEESNVDQTVILLIGDYAISENGFRDI